MYQSPIQKLTISDVWSPEKNAPIREAAMLAYRLARVKAQIKWAPDHVDPDDIDPVKFAAGGAYYNSPETVRHYEAAKQYSKIGNLDLILGACLWKTEEKPLALRLQLWKDDKFWKKLAA